MAQELTPQAMQHGPKKKEEKENQVETQGSSLKWDALERSILKGGTTHRLSLSGHQYHDCKFPDLTPLISSLKKVFSDHFAAAAVSRISRVRLCVTP